MLQHGDEISSLGRSQFWLQGCERGALNMNCYLFKFIKLIACVSPLLWLMACASSGPVSTQISADSLMQEVEKRSNLAKQFRAEFTKTRHSPVFGRDVVVHGSLIFKKPNNVRLLLSGDVNVEILSDGKNISVTHDGKDQEIFQVHGERDLSRFSDPLMLLLQNIGDDGLRKFAIMKNVREQDSTLLQLEPVNDNKFERIRSVTLQIADSGDIRKVGLFFKDGGHDETLFESWSLLTTNDPEIERLNSKLQRLAELSVKGSSRVSSKSTPDSVPSTPTPTVPVRRLEARAANLF
jgi:outer membrane lipoprotein-sorting protein